MKTFLLRILPFLISLIVGICLFSVEEYLIQHEGVSTLLMGIASGLFGIPIIFIFYETITSFSRKHIQSVITKHIIFEMNYPLISLLKELSAMLNFKEKLSGKNIHTFLAENRDLEHKTPNFSRMTPKKFQQYKDKILKIMYHNSKMDVLPEKVIQTLLSAAEELGVIASELEEKKKRAKIIKNSLEALIDDLEKWIEFCELDAIINHHTFTFLE